MATANTLLTQDYNTRLMGLLNTRTADGRVNLKESTAPIYPGSIDGKNTPYFAYGFEQTFPLGPDSTPGNAAMRNALSKITGQDMSGANFDDATIQTLSDKLKYLQPAQWVKVANILQLNTGS